VRVALATKWFDEAYTGVGLYVHQLAQRLAAVAQAEDVDLTLVHKDPSDDPLYTRAREVRYSALPGPLWVVSQESALRRLAREVDIVHEPYIGVRRKLPCKQVITVHDTMPLDFPEHSPASFRAYFRRAMPRVLANADAVIVNSNTTKEDVLRNFDIPRERVHVTYLGCDHVAPAGERAPSLRAAVRADLAAGGYFLAVGTLGTKNIPASLAAVKAYRASHDPSARLVVAGTLSPADARAVAKDPELARAVTALGHLPAGSLPALYEGAAAVIHPALYEGFGFVPLEAMRLGVPVVTSGRGALKEVCADGALTAPAEDPAAIANAMATATDPARRGQLVARGRARADRFLWEHTAKGTLLVYRSLLRAGG
jgi:glycosyltransferase involved in cell wall biosynthesis